MCIAATSCSLNKEGSFINREQHMLTLKQLQVRVTHINGILQNMTEYLSYHILVYVLCCYSRINLGCYFLCLCGKWCITMTTRHNTVVKVSKVPHCKHRVTRRTQSKMSISSIDILTRPIRRRVTGLCFPQKSKVLLTLPQLVSAPPHLCVNQKLAW